MQTESVPASTLAANRARIIFLFAASIVPAALAISLLVGYDYFKRERARIERDALSTARALSAAVDAKLAGARSVLLVLAKSPYLGSGELASFHAQARQVLEDQAFTNIILTDAGGGQLVNTFEPYGKPLPAQGDPGGLLRVFETGKPVISDLFVGRATGRHFIGVGVPVMRGGKVLYGLNGGISPDSLNALLAEQRLPAEWLAGVFDSAGTVVARTRDSQRFMGRAGSAELVRRLKDGAREGAFQSETLEGISSLTVYSRSANSGWTIAIGIPQKELTAQLLNSLVRLFLGVFVVLASALCIAVFLGRRVLPER